MKIFPAVVLVHYDHTTGHSQLVIERVTKKDSGTYTCVAENRVGTIKSLGFVSVLGKKKRYPFDCPINDYNCPTVNQYFCWSTEPPIIDKDPRSNRIEPLGGNAILNCEVRGDPLPTIRWSKNGIRVTIGNRIRQLNNGSLAIYGTMVHVDCAAELQSNQRGTVVVKCASAVFRTERRRRQLHVCGY